MALSALDFPFCFLAVRWLGTERIGQWEHAAVEWVKRVVPVQVPEKWRAWWGTKKVEERAEMVYDHGVREAEEENSGDNASTFFPFLSL